MLTVIIFILVLGVLVLAHEFGHFIAARRTGMRVEEFGFGFPPRLGGVQKTATGWRWIWGSRELNEEDFKNNTVYSINWLPIGGFVKIKGENGGQAAESDSFMAKSAWKKTIVLAAGVIMNILLAAVLLSIGYAVGLPGSTDTAPASAVVKDQQLQVVEVIPGKPAQVAGLQSGDTIVQLDTLIKPSIKQLQDYLNTKQDTDVNFVIKRGSETLNKTIKPIYNEDSKRAGIGIAIAEIGLVKYPWYLAIYHGFVDSFIFLKEIAVAFYLLIAGLFVGKGAAAAVSGPVGIAVMTGQAARLGFAYLLQFTAMLSLNLALINILPLPALDGGRILFVWLGKIFRRPMFMKFEQAAHSIGFLLLILLVLVVTVKDLGMFKNAIVNLIGRMF